MEKNILKQDENGHWIPVGYFTTMYDKAAADKFGCFWITENEDIATEVNQRSVCACEYQTAFAIGFYELTRRGYRILLTKMNGFRVVVEKGGVRWRVR